MILNRQGGLGDVCMVLCAARALGAHWRRLGGLSPDRDWEIRISTGPEYRELVRASSVRDTTLEGGIDLNAASFGLSPLHQVDAYLEALGEPEPDPELKILRLDFPETKPLIRADWIALHPSVGDPNRTWPNSSWELLAAQLRASNLPVLIIGQDPDLSGKGAYRLPGYPSAFNLSHLELASVLDQCKVLVSCDSGPIQLAGATNCSVVGLYSVVPPERRMPYRSKAFTGHDIGLMGPCGIAPCYDQMKDPEKWNKYAAPRLIAGEHLGKVFGEWCPKQLNRLSCMNSLSVDTVYNAVMEVVFQNLSFHRPK